MSFDCFFNEQSAFSDLSITFSIRTFCDVISSPKLYPKSEINKSIKLINKKKLIT